MPKTTKSSAASSRKETVKPTKKIAKTKAGKDKIHNAKKEAFPEPAAHSVQFYTWKHAVDIALYFARKKQKKLATKDEVVEFIMRTFKPSTIVALSDDAAKNQKKIAKMISQTLKTYAGEEYGYYDSQRTLHDTENKVVVKYRLESGYRSKVKTDALSLLDKARTAGTYAPPAYKPNKKRKLSEEKKEAAKPASA